VSSKFILSFFIIGLCGLSLRGDVVGTTTAVSIPSYYSFPQNPLIFDNEIRGFAWMKNGFKLASSNTECLFNALFPVGGVVNLNGGTLRLGQDLTFMSSVDLQSLGTIIGNNHRLLFGEGLTSVSGQAGVFESLYLVLSSNLDISTTLLFQGDCHIFGSNGGSITLKDGGAIIVDENSTLELHDLEIRGVGSNNIRCNDDSGSLVLENVRWLQEDNFSFNEGSLFFKNDVQFHGGKEFVYTSAMTSTIASYSRVTFFEDMTFKLGLHVDTLQNPLYFTDATSQLNLTHCTLSATGSGLVLTRGTCTLDGKVTLDALGTTTQTGLILGTGNQEDDITIRLQPGAAVQHNSGYWVYNNYNPQLLQSSSKTARLIRGEGSHIYVPQNYEINDLTVELVSNAVPPLEVATGKIVSYINAGVLLPDIALDMTVDQLNYYTYQLIGGSLFLTKGTLPMYLVIGSTNNQIHGNGSLTGQIIFVNESTQLLCGLNGSINNLIHLSNGEFILDSDLWLFEEGAFVGPGVINLKKNQLIFKEAFSGATPLRFQGETGSIVLNENISLLSTWTIQGSCKIIGNGSTIHITDLGNIFVDTNSELFLKNVRIIGLHDQNISCSDSSSRIHIENSDLILDGNYTFSMGSMTIASDNYISGGKGYAWLYESDQTSTILSDSRLVLWDGLKLNIGRKNGNEPLAFESNTSTIKFDDSSFYVRNTGLQLKKGKIVCARDVVVDVDSTSTANGIVFGDGTSENDMTLHLSAATTTRFTRGHLTYDMSTDVGISSNSQTAQMIRYAGSVFYLKHDLQLRDITIDISPYAQLLVDADVELRYTKGRIKNGQDEFEVTAQWYNPYTMLMIGGDIINLNNGTMPLYLLALGAGNRIDGLGNVGGLISLVDSASEIICNFNGQLGNSLLCNNGTVHLEHDLTLGNDVQIYGPGSVQLGLQNITFGENDLIWGNDIRWIGTQGVINLRSNLSLNATWTIEGNCTIKGSNNVLQIKNGSIVIAPESRLTFQNINLENIHGSNISCQDDTGVLILTNVNWGQRTLDDPTQIFDFSFSQGSLLFNGKNSIRGNGIFIYETSQTSTILTQSTLKIDTNMTFSYYPANGGFDLIHMDSDSSLFSMNSASLVISTTGLQLSQGQMNIKGDSLISADVQSFTDDSGNPTKIGKGLLIGNGNSEQDCSLTLSSGARLVVKNGLITFKNQPSSLKMENSLSTIIFYPFTTLILDESINLGKGQLVLDKNASVQRKNGSEIVGSVFVEAVA
jgi:hypothetical protein